MPFRKTFRSSYFPPVSLRGFGEVKFIPSSAGESSRYVSRTFVNNEDVSKSTLPLCTFDAVLASGTMIDGRVSFGPSDPAVVETTVHAAVADYISSHPSTPVKSESNES